MSQNIIEIQVTENSGLDRTCEPITMGIPWPQSALHSASRLALHDPDIGIIPLQTSPLAFWPDKSIQWLLLDFQTSIKAKSSKYLKLSIQSREADLPEYPSIKIESISSGYKIDTGPAVFSIGNNLFKPFEQIFVSNAEMLSTGGTQMSLKVDEETEAMPYISHSSFPTRGPVRATFKCDGFFQTPSGTRIVAFSSHVHFYLRSSLIRMDFTLKNENAAGHPGGLWDLGSPGSFFFRDLSFRIPLKSENSTSVSLRSFIDEMSSPSPISVDEIRHFPSASSKYVLYQDSSGGPNWQSRNHVNRNGKVCHKFRGYRFFENNTLVQEGDRIQPTLSISAENQTISASIQYFWQNFPNALEAHNDSLLVRPFPEYFSDVFELQGGEQKTHSIYFKAVVGSKLPCDLAWINYPLIPKADLQWYSSCKVLPFLVPQQKDPSPLFSDFISSSLHGNKSLFCRRETIDEYGWRHFGDIHADHETSPPGQPSVISHYNNQYDCLYAFILQFFRTGDSDWVTLAEQLARHVADIDIYHTNEDKPEYNHGLFWHTEHYIDASTSTHRCFSKKHLEMGKPHPYGGGPALSHLYTQGLLYHYFLTGSDASRSSLLELSSFACLNIAAEQAIFNRLFSVIRQLIRIIKTRFLKRKPIYSKNIYNLDGPGRASGNCLNALLDAFILTQDRSYIVIAEKIISQCIHPDDDIDTRDLLDAECRWMYTIFLQSLTKYLLIKEQLGISDSMYIYAKSSLIHYVNWMLQKEYPFLDRREILDYPNETWAAQDLRKSVLFLFAARYLNPDRAQLFVDKARFFFDKSMSTLASVPNILFIRPLIISILFGSAYIGLSESSTSEPIPMNNPNDMRMPSAFNKALFGILNMKRLNFEVAFLKSKLWN